MRELNWKEYMTILGIKTLYVAKKKIKKGRKNKTIASSLLIL